MIDVINESDKKFNDLYANHRLLVEKKQTKVNQQKLDIKAKANNKKISFNSEQIANKIKDAVFTRIFEMLDESSEGRLYGDRINLALIPEKLQSIMAPLTQELKDQNESLTCEEFLMACEHVYLVYSIY